MSGLGRKDISCELEKKGLKMRYVHAFRVLIISIRWHPHQPERRATATHGARMYRDQGRVKKYSEGDKRELVWRFCSSHEYENYLLNGMRKSRAISKAIRMRRNVMIDEWVIP